MVKPTKPTPPDRALRSNPSTFSANAEAWITYQWGTFPDYVDAVADFTDEQADAALAAALGGDLPPLTGKALQFLRVNAGETAAEFADVPSVGGSSDTIPTTSGTSASFTGIPAGVQRVTVALNSVDIAGTDSIFITLGTASGIVTSGYSSSFSSFTPTGQDTTSGITAAFGVTRAGGGSFSQGEITFTRTGASSNIWTGSGQFWSGDVNEETSFSFGTSPNLGGELTQIRVASGGGTNSLDSGSFRVFWSF